VTPSPGYLPKSLAEVYVHAVVDGADGPDTIEREGLSVDDDLRAGRHPDEPLRGIDREELVDHRRFTGGFFVKCEYSNISIDKYFVPNYFTNMLVSRIV
jgi:hypothetical protein